MRWLRRPLPWIAGALLLAVGQSAALGAMLWERISILRSDTVITLKAEPLDPRDIFRGDYVILTYNISQHTLAATEDRDAVLRAAPLWVVLSPHEADGWKVASVVLERPSDLSGFPDGSVTMQAQSVAGRDTVRIRYGLERYYVPEGEGLELEKMIGEERITVDVAIGPNGAAGIKALRVDGEVIYEEPLF